MLRALAFTLPLLLVSNVALAVEDDCPPGSYQKSESGFTWCQPTVCMNDTQCSNGLVCRQFGLCMKIGEISEAGTPAADGGARIFATQVCAPEKSCPQFQTCSTMGRCFEPDVADRLGILATKPPADAPKKSSCGCSTVGMSTDGGLALAGFGLATIALRARARRRAR